MNEVSERLRKIELELEAVRGMIDDGITHPLRDTCPCLVGFVIKHGDGRRYVKRDLDALYSNVGGNIVNALEKFIREHS
jgi:hypothetical protein